MSIHSAIGATVALGLVLVSLSNVAVAQSRTQKKPNVGGKPLMQIKPSAPIGCKLVGSVKGTKLWAGNCMASPELRTTAPEDKVPTPSPETETAPKEQQ
jgi:hypothetical protein